MALVKLRGDLTAPFRRRIQGADGQERVCEFHPGPAAEPVEVTDAELEQLKPHIGQFAPEGEAARRPLMLVQAIERAGGIWKFPRKNDLKAPDEIPLNVEGQPTPAPAPAPEAKAPAKPKAKAAKAK